MGLHDEVKGLSSLGGFATPETSSSPTRSGHHHGRPTRTRSISPSVAEPGAGPPKATTVAEHEDARSGGKGEYVTP
jgi:hypothetical protein